MSTATKARPGYGTVPNGPIREAVEAYRERTGVSLSELAQACEWTKKDGRGNVSGDTSRLGRALGSLPDRDRGRAIMRTHMSSSTAATIVRAIGMMPVDFDF